MQIQFHDIKDILNKVKQGGGSNYTPLEIELAKMAYRYRRVIAEKAEEESLLRDELFRIYSCVNSTRSASDLLHRRAASLADKSKAHFAAAVKLDEQLKELTENDTSEGKD